MSASPEHQLFHPDRADEYVSTMRLGVDHLADALRRVSGPATGQAAGEGGAAGRRHRPRPAAARRGRRARGDEPDLPRRRGLVPRADVRRPPQLPGGDPRAARRGVRRRGSTPRSTRSTRASAAPSSSGTSSTGPRPGSASAAAPTASSPAAAPSPTSRDCTSPATACCPAAAGDLARLRIFASDDGHFSVQKSARLLGLGDDAVVSVPTDSDRRMDVGALEQGAVRLRVVGLVPMAVVATAGTTDFGAIDPLRDHRRALPPARHLAARRRGVRRRAARLAPAAGTAWPGSSAPTR